MAYHHTHKRDAAKSASFTVSHHLSDETLLDYANGSLSSSMETLVACHLTVCSHCRERSLIADDVGGELLINNNPAAVKVSAVDVLRRAHSEPAICASKTQNPIGDTSVPRPLGRLLPGPVESLSWRNIAPGIKQYSLSERPLKEGAFKLLRLEPGVTLSQHSHNERELTYVVRGSYRDELGQYRAGDIADLDDHIEHRPVVDSDEVCIALIATDAPVKYSTVLGKIMQPFVGI